MKSIFSLILSTVYHTKFACEKLWSGKELSRIYTWQIYPTNIQETLKLAQTVKVMKIAKELIIMQIQMISEQSPTPWKTNIKIFATDCQTDRHSQEINSTDQSIIYWLL